MSQSRKAKYGTMENRNLLPHTTASKLSFLRTGLEILVLPWQRRIPNCRAGLQAVASPVAMMEELIFPLPPPC